MKNAIILCSGGLDSVTVAHYARKKLHYGKVIILFFNYGQRTIKQERLASKICAKKIRAKFIEIELKWLGEISTSLINQNKKAHKIKRKGLRDTKKESINWYVPCRNTIFITYAMALADANQIKNNDFYDILTGFKCEGKDSYPDTTPEFVKEINSLKKVSTNLRGKIIAPLIKKDKNEIIELGKRLEINFAETYSCYVGIREKHCGYCLACRLRQEAFYWANIKDPTKYELRMKDFRLAK